MKPVGGMYLDCAPADQPAGTYRKALNIVLNRLRDAVAVESGTALAFSLPAGYVPVAHIIIDGNNVAVLSAINTHSTDGEIGIYNETTGVYTSVLSSANLNFSLDHPVKMISYRNYNGDRIIVWTDNYNPPRIYNLDNPGYTLSDFNSNPSLMNLFPECIVPGMTAEVAESSGSLPAGSYYFAIAYELSDGFVTDYLCISNPVPIFTPETGDNNWVGGGTPGVATSKGVKLTLSNMDLRYQKFRVAIVSLVNGVYTAKETPAYYLQSSMEVVISDLNNTTDILLEDVTINRANYTKAKTLTYENRKLYMGGMSTISFPDYQAYANNIQVRWTAKYTALDTPVTESFKDGTVCIYDKGFMPGEVYSLYIAWLLKDGSYSPAFHIPGRAKMSINPLGGASSFDEDTLISDLYDGTHGFTVTDCEMDLLVNSSSRFFHMRHSALADGTMSYWENEETYPADFPNSYTGTVFAGTPVRHHKFPSLSHLATLGFPMFTFIVPKALTLGIKLHNVPLPSSIADLVQGFEIFYVKRTYGNSLVNSMSYLMSEGSTSSTHQLNDPLIDPTSAPIDFSMFCPDLQKNEEYPAINAHYLNIESEVGIPFPYDSYTIGLSDEALTAALAAPAEPYRTIIALSSHEYMPFTPDYYKEARLKVTTKQTSAWTYTAGFTAGDYTMIPVTINSFRTNAYPGLSYQQLVSTGKQFFIRDSASMDYGLVSGVNCFWYSTGYSDDIYGGDIYTHRFYHFTNFYAPGGTSKQRNHFAMAYWSHSNIGLRVSGTEYGQRFLPMDALGTYPSFTGIDYGTAPSDLEPDAEYKVDNYVKIYDDYSKSGELNFVYPYVRSAPNLSEFPNRIISSQPIQNEDTGGSLRKFLPADYYEMPKNRGPITNLEGFNGMLLIHTEDSLYKTTGRVQLKTDTDAVVVGSGNIFDIEPQEIFTVPGGYAGCQHPYGTNVSKSGYFFIDNKANKVFMMRESLDEISNAGLRNYFEENLQFQLVKDVHTYLATWADNTELFSDNPFSPFGVGYTVAFDDRYMRLIFSKRDFQVINATQGALLDASYQMSGGCICTKGTPSPTSIEDLIVAGYLEDNSFTLSYDVVTKRWASFHSYHPAFMLNTRRNFYGALVESPTLYRFNEDYQNGNYMGNSVQPSWLDITVPDKQRSQSVTSSVSWTSALLDSSGNPDFYKTWDRLLVYNTHQCSGWKTIDSAGAGRNARFAGGRWHFNDFRDMTTLTGSTPPVNMPVQEDFDLLVDSAGDPVNIDTNKAWNYRKRFIDTYCIIRFGHSNSNNGIVYLYDLETSGRPVVR